MRTHFKGLLLFAGLILAGQGCFGGGSGPDGAVWKSTDGGDEWAQSAVFTQGGSVGSINNLNINVVQLDPQDHRAIYIGTNGEGPFFSYDAGQSWQRPRDEAIHKTTVTGIAVNAKDKCTIYVATEKRLYKTEDCSRTFNNQAFVESRPQEIIVDVDVDHFNPNVVWIANSAGDVFKSTDGGNNWATVLRAKNDVTDVMIDKTDSRVVYVATARKGIFRTMDAGQNWTELQDNVKDFREANRTFSLTMDADGRALFAATKYGIIRSTDRGDNWQGLSLLTPPGGATIYSLEVAPDNPNQIYYGTSSTFYSSSNGGANWDNRRLPSRRAATDMAVDPEDSSVVYLGVTTLDQ